jgi:glycosyltransferase involved in cell wall biosynthesis
MKIAVVIPAYKVRRHVLDVIAKIGPEVGRIIVVDDACPERSGDYVEENARDPRVMVVRHDANRGVGGAMVTGYRAALADGADIVVKIDGDDQMDPALLGQFVDPILAGEADYAKGNRFHNLDQIRAMPGIRLFGNTVLSFMAKLSTGYWDIFDPTNGYTAIHGGVLRELPLDKLSRRYFFETDMLFRLNLLRAVVVDVPMDARYGDETSNLRVTRVLGEFLAKHARNLFKRIFYNYYLRDLSIASIELPLGILLVSGGGAFGLHAWLSSAAAGTATPAGRVMLSALPILVGIQLLLAFVNFDIAAVPRRPLSRRWQRARRA